MAPIPPDPLFFEEFLKSDKTMASGNVIAVFPETKHRSAGRLVYAALGRAYPHPLQAGELPVDPDQPVTDWTVDELFLATYCRKVTEKQARAVPSIHTFLHGVWMRI